MAVQIINYVSPEGVDVVDQWLRSIRDKTARAAIERRILRAGYRAYYGQVGEVVILLLCGGDKRSQDADIEQAIGYLATWKGANRK
jgi:putative component of toxin-antitoxin plasmid stabilization module